MSWQLVEKKKTLAPKAKAPPPPLEEKKLFRAPRQGRKFLVARTKRRAMTKVSVPQIPRPLDVIIQTHAKLRFNAAANLTIGSTIVTSEFIIGAMGVIATGSTAASAVHSSFRIHRIIMWPAAGGDAEVHWLTDGDIGKETSKTTNIPTGITNTEAVVSVPPKNSLFSDWIVPGDETQVFRLVANSGTIIELDVSGTLYSGLTAAFAQQTYTLTGPAVAGQMYYLALDGPVQDKVVPLGLGTIH